MLSQGGREVSLVPGDLTITDQTRPYQNAAGYSPSPETTRPGRIAHQELKFLLPHASLPLSAGEVDPLTAVRFSGRDTITKLVAPVLAHLLRCAEHDTAIAARLSSVLIDLLASELAERIGRSGVVPVESHRRALRVRIHAFIDERLAEPDLSPQLIADAHHISLRHLHKLFESQDTTVATRIRRRRLERCRRELVDPTYGSCPVSAIAGRWGFGSAEHFTRVFRATYGVPPGEYRRLHLVT